MAQLVCNEVTLVNNHHSNKVRGSEAVKHGCLGLQTWRSPSIWCLCFIRRFRNICKRRQRTLKHTAPVRLSLMMSTSWSPWIISLARTQTPGDVASDQMESVPAERVYFWPWQMRMTQRQKNTQKITSTVWLIKRDSVLSTTRVCRGIVTISNLWRKYIRCRCHPQEYQRFSTKSPKVNASNWILCRALNVFLRWRGEIWR